MEKSSAPEPDSATDAIDIPGIGDIPGMEDLSGADTDETPAESAEQNGENASEEFNPFGSDIDILNDPVLHAIANGEEVPVDESAISADSEDRVELGEGSVGFGSDVGAAEPDFEINLENFGEDFDTEPQDAGQAEGSAASSKDSAGAPDTIDIASVGGMGGEDGAGEEGKKASFLDKMKGIFAKITGALTEEDDEEDDEANSLKLSDENAQILDEMNKEGDDGKKKKKGKKDKKADADGEEGGEEKKPKKEKKSKKGDAQKGGDDA